MDSIVCKDFSEDANVKLIRISVCEKVIQYASTYYNRQTINENHGYKSHNAKTLKSHFTKCTMPNCAIKPDNKIGRFFD